MVLLLPNHDLRSHAPGQRIPLLQPLLHHRQNVVLHRAPRLVRHHRRVAQQQHLRALLLPLRVERGERGHVGVGSRSEGESEGAGGVFGGGEEGEGEVGEGEGGGGVGCLMSEVGGFIDGFLLGLGYRQHGWSEPWAHLEGFDSLKFPSTRLLCARNASPDVFDRE